MNIFKQIQNEATISLFRKRWLYSNGFKKLLLLIALLFVLSNIVILVQPLILARLLNEIQANGIGDHNIRTLVIIMCVWPASEVLFWIFHGPARVLENTTAFKVRQYYREHLISNTLALGLSWHAGRDSGDTIEKIRKASTALENFSNSTYAIIKIPILIIGTTIALISFNLYSGLIVPVFIFSGFFIIRQFDKKIIPKYRQLNVYDNKTSGRIFDTFSNITSIKVLHIEKLTFRRIKELIWKSFKLYENSKIVIETKWFSAALVVSILTFVSMLLYIFWVKSQSGAVEAGSVGAVFMYLSQLSSVIYTIAWRYEDLVIQKTDILNAEDIEQSFSPSQINKKAISGWQEIHFTNILFRYQDSEQKQLNIEVDFNMSKGARIALIGESGSGKTTFLKVLHGMYPNARGTFSINHGESQNTNFADIELDSILVPQEPEIFSSSIRENITLGTDVPDIVINKVVELSRFDEVVQRLPQGLASVINEKGVNLSGGEKQRLALARALFFAEEKKVILLDESTSSVDPETEVEIYLNIFENFTDATIIASIHKMNLLKYFDRIVIFCDGKITDEGSFETLLRKNSKFRHNWEEYIARDEAMGE